MDTKQREFGALFWLHLLLIVVAYLSPVWLDWKAIVAAVVGLQLYYWTRGGCDLTFWELSNDANTTFVWHYLQKVFPRLDKRKTKFFVRVIIPILLIVVALISQVLYTYRPYISF